MGTVSVGGVELCYQLLGPPRRPVVLLVSGLGSPLVGWDAELCHLFVDEGFRVLRFDNRDAGRSTSVGGEVASDLASDLATARRGRGAAPYTLDDMADDAAGVLAALGVASAHVVGASMGGMIAQVLAVRHAPLVHSLCSVMSTTGAPGVGAPTPEALDVVLTSLPTADREEFVARELENARVIGSHGDLVDEGWRRRRFGRIFDWGYNAAGVARQVTAIVASGDRTSSLASVTAPTLVVHGTADTLVAPSGGEATARAVPGAELLLVPDLGHEIPPAAWPALVGAVVANARRAGPLPSGATVAP